MQRLQRILRPPSLILADDLKLWKEMNVIIEDLRRDVFELDETNGFIDWAKRNGIWNDKLEIKSAKDYGSGIFAKESIELNELLVQVPQHLMITSIPRHDIKDALFQSMPSIRLVLHLIIESVNEQFKDYLSILPRKFNLPIFYCITEMEQLKNLSVMHDCIKEMFLHVQQYFYLRKVVQKYSLFPIELLTFGRFEWARAIALTRQNPIKHIVEGKITSELALIPLFDMFNHSSGDITGTFDIELNAAQLFSNTVVKPGDQVFMSYGSRSNQELFMYCGFVSDSIEYDFPKVFFSIPKGDSLYNEKVQMAAERGLKVDGYYPFSNAYGSVSEELLFLVTLMFCTLQELEVAKTQGEFHLTEETKQKIQKWLLTKIAIQKMTLAKRKPGSIENCNRLAQRELEYWTNMESII